MIDESDAGVSAGISRRALLTGTGVAGAMALGTLAFVASAGGDPADVRTGTPVPAGGEHQAGIQRPPVPQQHCLIAVLDLDLASLRSSLGALGAHIDVVTAQPHGLADLTPDGPADLTITVGLGPDALAATAHPELAGVVELPEFAGDAALPAKRRGGDLLVSVNASDPTVLEPVLSSLLEQLEGARLRWTEFGYRGTAIDGVARNPFGYFDGIIRPTTPEEFREDVWISTGPLAGGTVCVIRRFRLDVDGFRDLPPTDRDAVMGRVQSTGAPLSGGSRDDQIDLNAKSADGTLLVPSARARPRGTSVVHRQRAHAATQLQLPCLGRRPRPPVHLVPERRSDLLPHAAPARRDRRPDAVL